MRNWTRDEVEKLIESERLAVKGAPTMDIALLQKAEQLDHSLRMNQELYVIPYHKENDGWQRKQPMTFNDYSELILSAPSQWACHPVNFETLEEFDVLATRKY